jgi:hypothetical protein
LKQKLNGGTAVRSAPPPPLSQAERLDWIAAKWEIYIDRHVTLRVAISTIACGAIRLNPSFEISRSIRNPAILQV